MNVLSLDAMGPLWVDILLAISVMTLLLADSLMPPGGKRGLGYMALAQVAVCFVATFLFDLHGEALGGAYFGSALALMFKRIFLVAGFLAILGSLHQVERDFSRRQGEYYQLLLFSLLGMSLLSGARDLILLVVSFELMGIPLYVLATFARTGEDVGGKPAEAGLKLYIIGAASSAISLYGLSLVYGLTGTTEIAKIGETASSPLLVLGLTMLIAGFGFKIGVAPFHMWVPDTYQGTSTPFAGFLSVGPKGAGLVALIQILVGGALKYQAQWAPLMVGLIVATLVIGNLMALRQTNIKRLLGFSGVAHMGFLLLGIVSVTPLVGKAGEVGVNASAEGLATTVFYLVGYLVTNMGLFMVVEAVSSNRRETVPGAEVPAQDAELDTIDSWAGIAYRTPWIGLAMLLFLLSLAGIPFVVGFWAKVYILVAAWQAGFDWLVVTAAALSIVGLFYYLQVVRSVYMRKATDTTPLRISKTLAATIAICLAGTVGLGMYPSPFIEAARHAAVAFMGII